jgi:Arc/MetJ-type ribon-helix-helix transcriptional regulator
MGARVSVDRPERRTCHPSLLQANGANRSPPPNPKPVRESKVTIKIPRPLYRKIQQVVEESGFDSPTDFIVYVLRDLMGKAEATAAAAAAPEGPEFTQEELDDVKRKLRNLGYL